jgi:hypothetical protein
MHQRDSSEKSDENGGEFASGAITGQTAMNIGFHEQE